MLIIGSVISVFGGLMALEGVIHLIHGYFGYFLVYSGVGIAILYAGMSIIEKRKAKNSNEISPRMMSYYWDLEREIFNQCFDEKTRVFDWKIWFDRRDLIIHTAPENVLRDIDEEFRHCGKLQISYIDAIISNNILRTNPFEPSAGISILRREILDTEILLNLPSMYSFRNAVCDRKNCPEEVEKYCRQLRNILYGGTKPSREAFDKIVELGTKIFTTLS